MKLLSRLLKTALILVLLAGLGAGALVLWLRYYVQTPEFAADVKRLGGGLAGGEVGFDHLQWDIGRGITVENVHVTREGDRGETEPAASMQAWQIILKYNWQSLWHRQFEITRLTFKSPRFVLRQQNDGGFLLPFAPESGSEAASPHAPIEAFLGAFNLDNGEMRVLRQDGKPLLELLDVQAEGQTPENGNGRVVLSGAGTVAHVIFWGDVRMHRLQSPFRFDQDSLELSAVQADFYNGKLNGQWEQRLADDDLPYSAKLDVSGLDIGALLKEAAGLDGVLTGKLEAQSTWLGPARRPLDVSGEGHLELRQGRVLDVPFFQVMAERLPGLQILARPDYEQISLNYTLANRQVQFSELTMKSTLFEITGNGTVGFDQKLQARLKVAINPRLAERLPQEATGLMDRRADGYRTFSVSVGGSLQRPRLGIPVSDAMRDKALEGLKRFLRPLIMDGPPPEPPSKPQSTKPTPATE